MENIQEFCGMNKNVSFIMWNTKISNFSDCFQWTVVSNVVHGVFIIICAYLLGISRRKQQAIDKFERRWPIKAICLLLITDCALEVILTYVLDHLLTPAYILAKAVALSCWILCFVLQYHGFPLLNLQKKKNLYLLFASLLLLVSYTFQVHAVITAIINSNAEIKSWPVQYFGTLISFLLCLCFVVVCVVSLKCQKDYVLFINHDQKGKSIQASSSDDGTISSSSSFEDKYSTKYEKLDSDSCGETKSKRPQAGTGNILSQLTLWWVNKLVIGRNAQLKTIDDLFVLPNNLKTDVIRENFSNILKKERGKQSLQIDGKKHKKRSLLGILNRTYGKLFYSIGILKFLMLILELSAPIFLNYLIKFMENRNVSVLFICKFLLFGP